MPSGGDEDSDAPALSPDELDIDAYREVESLGDDRYVIGADGEPDVPASDASGDTDPPQTDDEGSDGDSEAATDAESADGDGTSDDERHGSGTTAEAGEITGRDVKQWLGDELDEHDAAYAYHIAAKSGDAVSHQQLATDDITAAFDGLLVWYARQVGEGTPVDEALGILLSESSVQVRYPTSQLVAYLERHDLAPEDSIADLLETVSEGEGLSFPRQE